MTIRWVSSEARHALTGAWARRLGLYADRAALCWGEENNGVSTTFPYETRLNILHGALEVIDEKALADACEYQWFNQTLCKVNDSVVRFAVVQGEYHWHKHEADDEFFS